MNPDEEPSKQCGRCHETRPLTEFHRMRSAPDGRQPRCKDCQKDWVYAGRGSTPKEGPLGHLYLVQFTTGRLKVGHAKNPDYRVSQHAYNGACLGNPVTRSWISDRVEDPGSLERLALTTVGGLASDVVKREWFDGVDFDEAVTHIRNLTKEQ